MGFHKLAVVSFAALLPMASHIPAQMNPSIDQNQLVNVHQVSGDETLWRIATNNALDGVSVWQLLISIYQLNPHAFIQNDISRLRTGSQLFLPNANQITSFSPVQAEAAFEQLLSGNSLPVEEKRVHQVRNGETLWRIASDNTLEGVSVWQTLMSMYQLNLHAFLKKDISRLRTDSTLVIPTLYQTVSLSPEAAELAYERLISPPAAFLAAAHISLPTANIIKTTEPLEPTEEKIETKKTTQVASKVEANSAAPITSHAAGEPEQHVVKKIESTVSPVTTIAKETPQTVSQKSNLAPAKSTFILKKVTIIGSESFSAETLHALIADAEGTEQDITQLGQLATRITQFYQDQGFSIARAILPAQAISQGNVSIQVIEAKYGQVNLINNSSVSDALLAATAAPMQPGAVISDINMYTSVLLFSDIPGLAVSSHLGPGSKVGNSDVTLVVEDSQPYSGSLTVDQHGDAYTGRERITGSVEVNNLADHGDVLTVSGMFNSGDMQLGRLAYDWLLNGDGTHLGAAYSGLDYRLGKEVAVIQANGTVRTGSAWVKHPLLRSLDANVSVQLQYDVNQLQDHIDSTSLYTDRTISVVSLAVTGDQRNTYSRGGISSWSFGLESGDLRFDNSAAESADASSANTKGRFAKINLNINHIQRISNKATVGLNVSGQWASHNLDSSGKLLAGGVSAVRAYNSGALSGDTGYVGSAAFRYYLTQSFDGSLTGSLFYDAAHIIVNKSPWLITSDNSASISGAGIGLDWVGPKQVSANLVVAAPTDSASTLVDDRPSHTVWLKIKKDF